MKCKMCGTELKKDGELCNNCMNQLMKEQEMRNDKSATYTFKGTFSLLYELLRNLEQIFVVIFVIVLACLIDMTPNGDTLVLEGTGLTITEMTCKIIIAALAIGYLILHFIHLRISVPSVSCTMYKTKLVVSKGIFKKKVKEIPYSEIEEISYKQGNMNRLFKNGTVMITRNTRNIMERFTYIESIKNVDHVFEKIKEIYN